MSRNLRTALAREGYAAQEPGRTVISEHDHDRGIRQAKAFQCIKNPPDIVVGICDRGVVSAAV